MLNVLRDAAAPFKRLAGTLQSRDWVPSIVVVPGLRAVDLTGLAKDKLKLTYLDYRYAESAYVDDQLIKGQALAFETLVVKKKKIDPSSDRVSSEQVRAYARDRGYFGNTRAFTEWRRQNAQIMGYHASILDDDACWRGSNSDLYVPTACFGDGGRELALRQSAKPWDDEWTFVAFRIAGLFPLLIWRAMNT